MTIPLDCIFLEFDAIDVWDTHYGIATETYSISIKLSSIIAISDHPRHKIYNEKYLEKTSRLLLETGIEIIVLGKRDGILQSMKEAVLLPHHGVVP